jgi:hypothetical protein
MSWKQCHKTRSVLKVFWKVAHENLLGMACKYHIGIYSGHIGITWFLGVGCTSRAHTQYKVRASKRLRATN